MKKILSFLFLCTLLVWQACKREESIDTEKPVMDLTYADTFPMNCDTLYFGETFTFKALFTDNMELGSFSMDIHHNFDHHSHSTEVSSCVFNPIRTPVKDYSFIQENSIPAGLKKYQVSLPIAIPSSVGGVLYDEGDYHFFISLVDKSGWATQKGFNIKMLHRKSK